MSSIILINDSKNKKIKFKKLDVSSNFVSIKLKFNKKTNLENFSFCYELKRKNNIELYNFFPRENTKFVSYEKGFLINENIPLIPNEKYVLYAKIENKNKTITKRIKFKTPKPYKEFKSWKWNEQEKKWASPIPYPLDGKRYFWREEKKEWIEIEGGCGCGC